MPGGGHKGQPWCKCKQSDTTKVVAHLLIQIHDDEVIQQTKQKVMSPK